MTDDTCDAVHGHQQLSLFDAHYDTRCFLPIHQHLVRRIRSHWPRTRILFSGGSHYARPQAMAWCAAGGATVVEKHFTLDRALPGPDHKASLEPDELTAMIDGIRAVEAALGDGVKAPMASEMANREVARRSLTALAAIAEGERFTGENLGAKRPGTGISPMQFWDWLGRAAPRRLADDEQVSP